MTNFCSTIISFRTYTKRAFLTHSFVVFDKLVESASFLSSQKMDLMYLPQLREFQGQEISPLQSSDDETYLLCGVIPGGSTSFAVVGKDPVERRQKTAT